MVEGSHIAELFEIIGEGVGSKAIEEHAEQRLKEVTTAALVYHSKGVVYESLTAVTIKRGKY